MEAQKRGSAKGKRKAESNVQQSRFQHATERVRVALSLLKNPNNTCLKEVRESARRVVDEELDKLAEQHGPFIPHHPIARKPMTRSQAK
ncbi:unnamed protein product [Prunus armeniaca]